MYKEHVVKALFSGKHVLFQALVIPKSFSHKSPKYANNYIWKVKSTKRIFKKSGERRKIHERKPKKFLEDFRRRGGGQRFGYQS
jgi:hypothetical protein